MLTETRKSEPLENQKLKEDKRKERTKEGDHLLSTILITEPRQKQQ
jgi:hypothetical protein